MWRGGGSRRLRLRVVGWWMGREVEKKRRRGRGPSGGFCSGGGLVVWLSFRCLGGTLPAARLFRRRLRNRVGAWLLGRRRECFSWRGYCLSCKLSSRNQSHLGVPSALNQGWWLRLWRRLGLLRGGECRGLRLRRVAGVFGEER